jgi:hypothetical protein
LLDAVAVSGHGSELGWVEWRVSVGEEVPGPVASCLAARNSTTTRRGKEVGRADAAAFLGLLVGTLQLARATPDRAESGAILEAGVRAALRLAKGDG